MRCRLLDEKMSGREEERREKRECPNHGVIVYFENGKKEELEI